MANGIIITVTATKIYFDRNDITEAPFYKGFIKLDKIDSIWRDKHDKHCDIQLNDGERIRLTNGDLVKDGFEKVWKVDGNIITSNEDLYNRLDAIT
jgi:hypothetical protein